MTATQGRLEAEIPVFARTDATGPGSGLGVGVKSGVDAGGSGVTLGAGGSGVTLGAGGSGVTLGAGGSGVGAGGGRHFCVEESHSTQPFPVHSGVGAGGSGVTLGAGGSGVGAGGSGVTLGAGGSGVGAGGSGVTLGAGGSGVGAGGGRHFCVEESHSTQPFPSHTPTEGVVAWEATPKRRVVPMNPRRTPTKIISSGVRFLGLVAIALPFSGRWLM